MTAEEKVRLVEEIKAALNEAANTVWRKGTMTGATWTRECFAALEELGRKAGYSTASSASRNGWLYDLIWWVEPLEGENAGRMTDLVLALESEWKTDLTEIRRDFQKLVQTRALIKVMVTDALNADKRASLKADIECFEQRDANDIYLFAIYNREKGLFDFVMADEI